MRHATRSLHTQAERSGFVREVLRNSATRDGYVLFLRNLLPVYEALETGLRAETEVGRPLAALAVPEVFRGAAIRADLDVLCGPGWETSVPVLGSASAYARAVADSARPARRGALAGHVYTRYLGDLNGGQILARLLGDRLQLPSGGLGFFRFDGMTDVQSFAAAYRSAIDALGSRPGVDTEAAVREARTSFRCSIALSQEVADCAQWTREPARQR